MFTITLRLLPALVLGAGLCSAGAVCAQTADAATGGASLEQLKVLQSIESGLWQVSTRMEPAPKAGAMRQQPDQGCLSSQNVAEDLRAFLSQEDGMSCKGVLQANTDELAVLQVICPQPQPSRQKLSVEESLLKSAPTLIEVRRFSNTSFQVSSKSGSGKVFAKKPGSELTVVQEYVRLDDCPW